MNMSHSEFNKIDWAAQHAAMAKLPRNTHQFVVRFVDHWFPSGRMTKLNNQYKEEKCPPRGKPDEASSHFLQCRHKAMERVFVI